MRRARILGEGTSYYHVVNRVIERRYLLGEEEKEFFCLLMRKVEGFSGVQILAYCLMDNHVHLCLKVEEAPEEISEDEVYARMEALYTPKQIAEVQHVVNRNREIGADAVAEKELDRFRVRMFRLEEFVKTLFQRFTRWYNKKAARTGPLWNDRYKSVLIEPPAHYDRKPEPGESTLFAMAAYIDLNPVRAGMVDDPKDYRWCSYAEAVAGGKRAREGLLEVVEAKRHQKPGTGEVASWRGASRIYRRLLFVTGEASQGDGLGSAARKGFAPEQVEEVEAQGGALSLGELLHCRIRYFSDGAVIGGKAFVNQTFDRFKERIGAKRETGAREMKGGDWGEWCSMRDLRGDPVE